MKCYLLSSDLMFGSRISSAASNCELETVTIRSADEVQERGIAIVDLTTVNLDITTTIRQLVSNRCVVVAIGPHVQAEKLAMAESAGAIVMTKGEAHGKLTSKLKELLSS